MLAAKRVCPDRSRALLKIFVLSVWLAVAFLSAGAEVSAVELSLRPLVRLSTRAIDNVLYSPTEKQNALGFDSGGGLVLRALDSQWRSTLSPSFLFRRFAVGDGLDAEEYGVSTENSYDWSPEWTTDFDFEYRRDSTLNVQFQDTSIENDVKNRDLISIEPSVSYRISDASSLEFSYAFNDVSFVDAENTGLIDYTYHQTSFAGIHQWDDKTSISSSAFVSKFAAPSLGNSSITYGFMGGVTRQISATLNAVLSAGYSRSEIDFLTQEFVGFDLRAFPLIVPVFVSSPSSTSSGGPISKVTLQKYFDDLLVTFDYVRQVSPTARGSQSTDQNFILLAQFPLTQSVDAELFGGFFSRGAEAGDETLNAQDLARESAQLAGTLSWRLSEEISIRGEYRFSRDAPSNGGAAAYAHSFTIWLNFDGPWRDLGSF